MNFNFNHFTVTDEKAAKALRKYLVRSDRAIMIERGVMAVLFYICGKVMLAEYDEIVKLKAQVKDSKKGD